MIRSAAVPETDPEVAECVQNCSPVLSNMASSTIASDTLMAAAQSDSPQPPAKVVTPVPFLTHMLEAFAKHGAFGLAVDAKGDVEIDGHHTVEDTGLVLGSALDQALGNHIDPAAIIPRQAANHDAKHKADHHTEQTDGQ